MPVAVPKPAPAVPPAAPVAARFEAALAERIGAQRFGLWFRGNTVTVPAGRELLIVVSNPSFQEWLQATFGDSVRRAAAEVLGEVPVRFVVDEALFVAGSPPPLLNAEPSATATTTPAGKKPGKATAATLFGDEPKPPPSLRGTTAKPPAKPAAEPPPAPSPKGVRRWKGLGEFAVGGCNRVAHASAVSVTDEPGECGNPLVLHGPVGTGKTHLLEGIYAGLRKKWPDLRPTYVTAEEFTTKYVQSCRFDKQAQFRRQFRDCHALLLDDLHFLATKPGSQKEFLHTLDRLVADGRQVVVTTDCHPRLAEELLPELVDRLLGGAVWPLQPPDEATRLAILRTKAAGGGLPVPEAVLAFLARSLKGNVRELEGAITSVRHYAKVCGRAVDLPLVREAVGELLRHTVRSVTLKDVDEAVCAVLRLASGTLQSKARAWTVSHPRMLAVYLGRKLTSATYGEISKHFGAKTHSTAVAAEKKVRAWIRDKAKLSLGEREWAVPDLLDRVERELNR